MKKELKFLTICPIDDYFVWQVHLWLQSLKEIGHSDKAIVLLYSPKNIPHNAKWDVLSEKFPEAEFHLYKDEHNIAYEISLYISVLRPYTAWRFWQDYPEMKDKIIFYCDSDILFTKDFNIDELLEDDVVYLSDTNSYINASYFDSKIKDVLPHKLESYKKFDILNMTSKICGINRQICEANNNNSGGAQYLLKNIDADFWKDVRNSCLSIYALLWEINKQFFPNEDRGFQKFCADMWAVLWQLWRRETVTKVVKQLDFAWPTDDINKLKEGGVTIYHNAGVTGDGMNGVPMFFKGKYVSGTNPLKDIHIERVYADDKAQKMCNWWYVKKLKELDLNYL